MLRFEHKNAVITGAAQGIGRATAMRLASEGAWVALVDREENACEAVCQEILSSGGRAFVVVADLETAVGVDSMLTQIGGEFDRIDVLVNNVGGTLWTKPFWEYSDEEMQREINRSLWPTLRCCRAVIPGMIQCSAGSIVNVGSVATRGIYRVPYAAAKGGVQAMTVAMARELGDRGVRVNSVSPGAIKANRVIPRKAEAPTEQERHWHRDVMTQSLQDSYLARLGEADEVAATIAFLASEEAAYITGEVVHVAGGGIG
ncbi:1,6-dihydroxycyclohexa-2,4-diene-1-carboxylate dehydrogenase [Pseudomaricurvus alkylphenolicus]|jgi:dihydroxycyclohexadiene carboxylate dehydrogenase|uniref:1,6-dihydroxycyclohexa-2,4-diene-1-carboxylate dehydrogenase n=1 Tax=Pseudomaricurvus alkylphenolicus TaxID=1306991 RepID=UPI001422269A|nr:1,6-dihydroxycyclohexa-2,4-diene-1-carboxylate dehydrogenase [Pseudomaricurvus alkylphenolicus]NIB40531.1 1,6-dihydroxycyclohexa-2,4-diene-1-carboxylate dehydrogenase [Pseudomaricurvus alkylphenolicus]